MDKKVLLAHRLWGMFGALSVASIFNHQWPIGVRIFFSIGFLYFVAFGDYHFNKERQKAEVK